MVYPPTWWPQQHDLSFNTVAAIGSLGNTTAAITSGFACGRRQLGLEAAVADRAAAVGTDELYDGTLANKVRSRRRDFCHSAAPHSPLGRRFNRDGEGASAAN